MTEAATRSLLTVTTHWGIPNAELHRRWARLLDKVNEKSPSRYFEWLTILADGLGHEPVVIEARSDDETVGMLPLAFMRSALFGKFLVGLPYLNLGGVLATDDDAAPRLIDEAIRLADELDVRYLELRNAARQPHTSFDHELTEKVHMRLELPPASEELWRNFSPKVRNQIRKAENEHVKIDWGGEELLDDFYDVFSRNMRDLGTPVFSRRLFGSVLTHLSDRAEVCVARHADRAVAGAILIHGNGISEVPSASSLRQANRLNGNMLMYWHLLGRAIERGQSSFDFGRSSQGSNTYRFKAQWGAQPHPAVWQYYVRQGSVSQMRPDHPKNRRRVAIWKRLPVWLTRKLGPAIVRGIP